MSNGLLYTNENSGSGGGASDYVADVFPDVSLRATDNTGLTSNANTNPLNLQMGNTDSMLYGGKTLFIKDLLLLKDRSKWYNNQATYQVVFNEDFPQIQAFFYGEFSVLYRTSAFVNNSMTQKVYQIKSSGQGGLLVTGLCRRVGFMLEATILTNQSASIFVDEVSDGTATYSDINPASDATDVPHFGCYMNSTTQSYGLHTYRIQNDTSDWISVFGVRVYFQNGGSNLEFRPGTTYSNKVKSTTTSGASLALPTYGSSLGGISKLYKTGQGVYTSVGISHTTVISAATGASGTNLVDVTAGTGSSFLVGYGVIFGGGSTAYVGSITNISTDTLTVSPTLAFGVSGPIYRAWYSNATYAINASLYVASSIIDFGQLFPLNKAVTSNPTGLSNVFLDPYGKWCLSGSGYGVTQLQSGQMGAVWIANGAGQINIEGNFAAADVEYYGNGATLQVSVSVNGSPGYSSQEVITGAVRRTLVSEAGTGWNRVVLAAGASNPITNGIKRITLFDRQSPIGQTTGLLAELATQQAYIQRLPTASYASPGTFQRVSSEQLLFRGSWVRTLSNSFATGVQYECNAGSSSVRYDYVGKDFALIGTDGGCTVTLDGVNIGASFNIMRTVASEGPHTLEIAGAVGTQIQAIDIVSSTAEMKSLQKIVPAPSDLYSIYETATDIIKVSDTNGNGAVNTKIRVWTTIQIMKGNAITYSGDANSGGVFTINKPGVYAISYTDSYDYFGISLNGTSLTTNPQSLNDGSILAVANAGTDGNNNISVTLWLNQGDALRAQQSSGTDGSVAQLANFVVQRLPDAETYR